MSWQRIPIAHLLAGFDAVIQISEDVIKHQIIEQAMPHSVEIEGFRFLREGDIVRFSLPPRYGLWEVVKAEPFSYWKTRVSLTTTGSAVVDLSSNEDSDRFTFSSRAALGWAETYNGYEFQPVESQGGWVYGKPEEDNTAPASDAAYRGLRNNQEDRLANCGGTYGKLLVQNGAMSVRQDGWSMFIVADFASPVVSFTPDNPVSEEVLSQFEKVKRKLISEMGMGASKKGWIQITPPLSIVGTLAGDKSHVVPTLSVQYRLLQSSTLSPSPCVAIGVSIDGGAGKIDEMKNALEGSDYAYIISNEALRYLYDYRWHTGDYPRYTPNVSLPEAYKEDGKNRLIDLICECQQVDHLDKEGSPWANFADGGDREDYLRLGGHFVVTRIISATHRDDGTEVPQKILDRYKLLEEPFPVTLPRITLSELNPPPAATPEAQAYWGAFRKGVTRHLSRPFAGEELQACPLSRIVNGVERVLLSRGVIEL